jgi:8-oxo-dGTP pyrophosphatase MutT (NUDIX family)
LGGGIDGDETTAEALVRELRQEYSKQLSDHVGNNPALIRHLMTESNDRITVDVVLIEMDRDRSEFPPAPDEPEGEVLGEPLVLGKDEISKIRLVDPTWRRQGVPEGVMAALPMHAAALRMSVGL